MNYNNIQVLTHAETIEQYELMRIGNVDARNKLIESSLRWALKLIYHYSKIYNMSEYTEDIVQDFNLYFCSKIEEWRPEKGKLTTFLNACINGFLLQWYSSKKCLKYITYIPLETKNLARKFTNDSSILKNLMPLRQKCVLDAHRLVKRVNITNVKKLSKAGYLNKPVGEASIDDVELFNKLFNLCSEKEKMLVRLRYFEGLNDCQIARMDGVGRMAIQHQFREIFRVFTTALDKGNYDSRAKLVRICPECQKEIEYSGQLSYNKGVKYNRSCQSCVRKRVMSVKV